MEWGGHPMLDIRGESCLTLDAAAEALAGRGVAVHPTTLRNWCGRGVRGHRLETAVIAGRRYTTLGALVAFLAKVNGHAPAPEAEVQRRRSESHAYCEREFGPREARS